MTMNPTRDIERAGKPIVVAMLTVIFIVCGTLVARSGVRPADGPQLNGEYRYARAAVRNPGVVITQSGPGSLRLQGTPDSLRLDVRDSTVAAVLAIMGRAFNVRYRSAIALDGPITGTYAGSLTRVIARVLDGYDYDIKHEGPTVEVVVLGRSRGRAEPARPTPAAVAPMRRRCGRSAGHRAACSQN
jgi:hypothetical protein